MRVCFSCVWKDEEKKCKGTNEHIVQKTKKKGSDMVM